MLEMNGYTVLEASDGATALEICERHAGSTGLMSPCEQRRELGRPWT